MQKADLAGSEPGLGLPGETRAAVTADVIALPVKPHTRVCEEVINRRGRSHVYVSSSRAVDVSLGTERSGFRAQTSKTRAGVFARSQRDQGKKMKKKERKKKEDKAKTVRVSEVTRTSQTQHWLRVDKRRVSHR